MSPIDYIKKGILEGNWETVCEGYERLTDVSLKLPIAESDNRAQKILDKITALLSENYITPKKSAKKVGRPKKNKKKTSKKKTTVTKDGEDSSLILDDSDKTGTQTETVGTQLITNEPDPEEVEVNKLKAVKSSRHKLQLNRKKDTIYEVKCNECGKSFESTRPSGEMGQKCRKCLNGLKSRFV